MQNRSSDYSDWERRRRFDQEASRYREENSYSGANLSQEEDRYAWGRSGWVDRGHPGFERRGPDDWRQPGPYSGMGPRGYRRSDSRIFEEVCDRLSQHGRLEASDIEVEVQEGEITLNGSVATRRDKRLAEDLAAGVSGVRDIHNRLRLQDLERARGRFGYGFRGDESATETLLQNIIPGMQVVGSDGVVVGDVKEVRRYDFLVDRSMARDFFIPYSACRLEDGQVWLNVPSDEVDDQGWRQPDMFGPGETQGQV